MTWPITNISTLFALGVAGYVCLAGGLTLFVCAVMASGKRADEDRVVALGEAQDDAEMLYRFAQHGADRAAALARRTR